MIHLRFKDEKGFTTVGMAISLFICIALIFSGAQLYRVQSASAEIQEVADVASLAAQNEVAEFETAATLCDAVCLSYTLFAGTMYGIGVVCACIPPTAALSEKFIEMGSKAIDMRKSFYDTAVKGLNFVQKLLPFLAAANAMGIAQANDEGALDARYFAVAALLPPNGKEIGAIADDGLEEVASDIEGGIQGIKDSAHRAEEASKRANDAKQRGFESDCGSYPAYCMQERAESLSPIASADNPTYSSVDAWSFSVALSRAKAYYAARLDGWTLSGGNAEEKANAILRKRFYEYANELLEAAYVTDENGSFDCEIPHMFRNTAEMRETHLYGEAIYPVTSSGSTEIMHAWSGCPGASGSTRVGSIKELDQNPGRFSKCARCEFVVSSLGNVASASTSIPNGFEHHYEAMRQAAMDYKEARLEADPLCQAVKEEASAFIDSIKEVFHGMSQRIEIEPPGSYGAISMVVNTAQNPADTGFESLFVSSGSTLGTRAAVSGATVIDDDTEKVTRVISNKLEGLLSPFGVVGKAGSIAIDCWECLLCVFEDGQRALSNGIESALDAIPLVSASGLGKWASDFLTEAFDAVGLAPVDLQSRKPILVNTGHVAGADGSGFAVNFMSMRSSALSGSTSATGFMGSIAAKVGEEVTSVVEGEELVIADFELPFSGGEYSIGWVLPEGARSGAASIGDALAQLIGSVGSTFGQRVWQ